MRLDEDLYLAILDNPDDDLPRLVMADWLREHGEEEFAEFIGVQCKLAKPWTECDWPIQTSRGPMSCGMMHIPGETVPKRCEPCLARIALLRRQRELMPTDDNGRLNWIARLDRRFTPPTRSLTIDGSDLLFEWDGRFNVTFTFSRGFFSGITCSARRLRRLARRLVMAFPIEAIRLDSFYIERIAPSREKPSWTLRWRLINEFDGSLLWTQLHRHSREEIAEELQNLVSEINLIQRDLATDYPGVPDMPEDDVRRRLAEAMDATLAY